MTVSEFIKGAPMRPPSHFIGPIAWWSDSLTCGGIERQVVASAKYFQERGRQITLLCYNITYEGNNFFLEDARSCSKVLEFSLKMIDHDLFKIARHIITTFIDDLSPVLRDSISAYTAWLICIRPRILHIWNADNLATLLAAVIAGVPRIIIAGQSLSPAQRAPYGFESVNDQAAFCILANIMQLPNVFMTNNSRAGCRAYEEWLGLPLGTVSLTPNIFDLKKWPHPDVAQMGRLRQNLSIPNHARILGGLFRSVSIKDPELWVSTAIRACSTIPDLYAVVGGPGNQDFMHFIAHTPFAGRILFPGLIQDVPAFLSQCSVFLHTAHVEGLPNAILEAQSYGIPVVTTRCGAVDDVVEHGKSGFVVDERNEVVLAKHVEYLLADEEFSRRAGQAGRERVAREFSPERAGDMLWRMYDMVLATTSDPAPVINTEDTACEAVESGDAVCPLVSIVLPTYNHLAFLPQAVDSVLKQDYPNFELIIVDDGSTDGTHDYLAGLSSPKIRTLSGPNTRLPTALNRGFALARGEYLTWTSADNICLPHFCGRLARALQTFPQAGFATAPFAIVDRQGFITGKLESKISLDRMLANNAGVAAFMYRRDVAQKVGQYDPALEGAEDWDMWLRLLEVTKVIHVPYVLYHYRNHDNSLTATISDKVRLSSTRTAARALRRVEKSGGVRVLFPQIAHCKDKELAFFHAHFILGSRFLEPSSFLKGFAAKYLGTAYAQHPDDLAAMGNYAVALAWHGRWKDAEDLFRKGEISAPEQFVQLREHCAKQRRYIGTDSFCCPTFALPELKESELLQQVAASQLNYTDF